MARARTPSDFEIRVVYGDKDLSEVEKPWSPTWRLIREAFLDICMRSDCHSERVSRSPERSEGEESHCIEG